MCAIAARSIFQLGCVLLLLLLLRWCDGKALANETTLEQQLQQQLTVFICLSSSKYIFYEINYFSKILSRRRAEKKLLPFTPHWIQLVRLVCACVQCFVCVCICMMICIWFSFHLLNLYASSHNITYIMRSFITKQITSCQPLSVCVYALENEKIFVLIKFSRSLSQLFNWHFMFGMVLRNYIASA